MNNGKVCVSVCAETIDEFIEKIKRAEEFGDLIELRFDCLNPDELEKLPGSIEPKDHYIQTFRPKAQGGSRDLTFREREIFWNSGNDWSGADFEEDVVENSLGWCYKPVICSYHDFSKSPDNLFEIYERLRATNADVVKIAVQTADITDSISIWKLLIKAAKENRQIIPIAMGEAGKWTRILGLAHGAFMTYASLGAGNETAPGQISAGDLVEVYRAKELDENSEIYGIIGSNTSYSMSPFIHNRAFEFHNLNAVFVPLQIQNLDEFFRRMVNAETREIDLNFRGFSVTIPHKQSIIEHLDAIDETARAIGAVNTVKIIDGKLYGYNTDARGFLEPLQNSYGALKDARVAILGGGGAARACIYALQKEQADVTIFARDLQKANVLAAEFKVSGSELKAGAETYSDFDILVNTTPLGMKGKAEGETPATAEQLKGLNLVYDLVYTPFQTTLLNEADRAQVPKIGGLAMLIAQAMEQQKIWTGLNAPMREMSRAAMERLR